MRIVLFGLLALLSTAALAEIYRYTDANGNTVFTDRPPAGDAAPIELPPANTVEMKVPEIIAPEPTAEPREPRAPYRLLSIGGIPDGEALRANAGIITLTAHLDPPLRRGHQLRFLFDGEPAAGASTATAVQLQDVSRGEHSVQLEVLGNGRVIQRSAIERFTVQRVHLGSPALRNRPAP
jgi:hypothetical protein